MSHTTTSAKPDERYKSTVGYQRNNPGNLMVQGVSYAGKATKQSKGGPVSFCTMAWGLRALAMDLKKKMESINKISAIIEKYAPRSENNTDAYIRYVAAELKKSAEEVIAWDDASKLVVMRTIIRMEIGYGTCPFSDDELKTAIESAKVSVEAGAVCELPTPYAPPR